MERRVTPPKRVTSPTWGPPPPCKQALNCKRNNNLKKPPQHPGIVRLHVNAFLFFEHG